MKTILKPIPFKYKFADEDAEKSLKTFIKRVGGRGKYDKLKAVFKAANERANKSC